MPRLPVRFLAVAALSLATIFGGHAALALSELKTLGTDPATPGGASDRGQGLQLEGSDDLPGSNTPSQPQHERSEPASVSFSHDFSKLPEPVRKLREAIVEAAASGEPERLRPLTGSSTDRTLIPGADEGDDPVLALKAISGDADGLEILAILIDLMSSGYAHVNAGAADEIYIWPYFAEKNVETLSAPEKVELLRIITAGDLMGMQDYGSYNFFQIGLTPDGHWKFLMAGE